MDGCPSFLWAVIWVTFNILSFKTSLVFVCADSTELAILNCDQLSLGTNEEPSSGSVSKLQFPPFLQSPPLHDTHQRYLVSNNLCIFKYVNSFQPKKEVYRVMQILNSQSTPGLTEMDWFKYSIVKSSKQTKVVPVVDDLGSLHHLMSPNLVVSLYI